MKTFEAQTAPVVEHYRKLSRFEEINGDQSVEQVTTAIEAALQRIADTGLFADVGYTVNSDALVIKLTPSASSQLQPAHFSNFVWWQPAELESLLEASVPGYHGQLPLAGTLTDQVKAFRVQQKRARHHDLAGVVEHPHEQLKARHPGPADRDDHTARGRARPHRA